MSTDNEARALSIDQLLEIERICDLFEQALIQNNAADVEEYARQASVDIRPKVREELLAINSSRLVGKQFASAPPDALTQTALSSQYATVLDSREVPDQLGRFHLLNQIGAGGTGVVWRAEDEHLRRNVAIKLPHSGRVSDPNRFIREARIVAKLRHPSIVRLLEVGQLQQQCYLVSELIDGESLAELLKNRVLPIREAVGMLVKIADALEYSHQNGIVHRDLKPHNILVDSKGHPYVTDFGLAKNCGVDEPSLTRVGQVIGTPAYMAPEQARGHADKADPRTDVYALGIILFKFLTGDVPFHGSLESVVYQVIHVDPPEPRQWDRNVPADLETICLKCLEKDPARRYESAAELSAELQRYLHSEPIKARPISALGRLEKWYKRNRTLAQLTTAIGVLLVAVTVGSTVSALMLDSAWQREHVLRQEAEAAADETKRARDLEAAANAKARQALSLAQHEAEKAKTEAEVSQQSLAFMRSIFEATDPIAWIYDGESSLDANSSSPKQLLRNATIRIRKEFDQRPLVQARLMDTLGNSCRAIGLFDEADSLFTDSNIIREANRDSYDEGQYALELAENTFYRGWLRHDRGEKKEVESLYREALESLVQSRGENDLLIATIHFQIGRLFLEERRNVEAIEHFERAKKLRLQHLPADSSLVVAAKVGLQLSRVPKNGEPSIAQIASVLSGDHWGRQLAVGYTQVLYHRQRKNYPSAISAYQSVVDCLRQRLGEDHPVAILAHGDFAGLLWDAGNYRRAYPIIVDAIEKGQRLAPHHPQLIHAMNRVATESLRNGRFEESHRLFTKLHSELESGAFDYDIEHGLMWTTYHLQELATALKHSTRLVEQSSDSSTIQRAWALYSHARVLRANGETASASAFDAQAMELITSKRLSSGSSIWLERVAIIFAHDGQLERAEKIMRAALKVDQRNHPADHPRVADRMSSLANILTKMGRAEEAAFLQQQAQEIRSKQLPEFAMGGK